MRLKDFVLFLPIPGMVFIKGFEYHLAKHVVTRTRWPVEEGGFTRFVPVCRVCGMLDEKQNRNSGFHQQDLGDAVEAALGAVMPRL